MSLLQILCPREERTFKGSRWVSISLRTLHLIGLLGAGGGFLFQAPKAVWLPYWILCMISGIGMVCLYVWYTAIWLVQLRGLTVIVKFGLLSALPLLAGYEVHALTCVIVVSSIISHAPGDVRYYSVFHRRRIKYFE